MSAISYKDEDVLKKLYWEDGLSCYLIGEKFGVNEHTIRYWMDKHKMPRRSMSKAVKTVYVRGHRTPYNKGKKLNEEHKKAVSDGLKRAYKSGRRKSWNKGKKESKEHREKISRGLIRAYTEGRRGPVRLNPHPMKGKTKVEISKERLERLYCEEGLSGPQIAKELGVSRQAVDRYRKQRGIPTRNASENAKRFNWIRGLTKETDPRVRKIAEQKRGKPRPDSRELMKDPQFRKKIVQALITRPTEPEQEVIRIIDEHGLPFNYTGDGQVIIGTLNPDFAHKNENKLIEVFGRAFHDPEESFREEIPWYQQYWGRMAYYAQYGYDCLILWDDEVDNELEVLTKIESFLEEG